MPGPAEAVRADPELRASDWSDARPAAPSHRKTHIPPWSRPILTKVRPPPGKSRALCALFQAVAHPADRDDVAGALRAQLLAQAVDVEFEGVGEAVSLPDAL